MDNGIPVSVNRQDHGMGVHYHAFPVRSDDLDIARQDPRHYLSCVAPDDDDYDEPPRERLHLFLEKQWWRLGRVFIAAQPEDSRMHVSSIYGRGFDYGCEYGYDGYGNSREPRDVSGVDLVGRDASTNRRLGREVRSRVLSPEEVRGIAESIAPLGEADVVAAQLDDSDVSHLTAVLRETQAFVTKCADAGLGVLYVIG